jgi:prepilin-type N-terminal cleavage/methylation domain-containing protein
MLLRFLRDHPKPSVVFGRMHDERAASVNPDSAAIPSMSHAAAPRVRRCPLRRIAEFAGFTLVELLVVVAILAIVLAALLPVLSNLREASNRARELAAARSLMAAWQQYAHDSAGAVLPGYRSGLSAYDAQRRTIAAQTIGITANRWVWRLAPYLGHDFNALYIGEHERMLRELELSDYSNYLYQTSVFPSFGLNSVWVGGDENFGGYNTAFINLYGKFYVTRLGEIERPAELIVFGSARGQDSMPGGEMSALTEGYFRIRSPWFNARTWASEYSADDAASCGNLSARNGGAVVTSFADGHTEARTPETLDDMRIWSNGATSKDWTLTPSGG